MLKTLSLAILISTAIPLSSSAGGKNAKCSLVIDGRLALNSNCTFMASRDGGDYFSDEKMVITCPNGKRAEVSSCYGYEQKVSKRGIFGYLFRDGASANICWNEGSYRKADACYEGLRRESACWASGNAKSRHAETRHSVRFCAYAN